MEASHNSNISRRKFSFRALFLPSHDLGEVQCQLELRVGSVTMTTTTTQVVGGGRRSAIRIPRQRPASSSGARPRARHATPCKAMPNIGFVGSLFRTKTLDYTGVVTAYDNEEEEEQGVVKDRTAAMAAERSERYARAVLRAKEKQASIEVESRVGEGQGSGVGPGPNRYAGLVERARRRQEEQRAMAAVEEREAAARAAETARREAEWERKRVLLEEERAREREDRRVRAEEDAARARKAEDVERRRLEAIAEARRAAAAEEARAKREKELAAVADREREQRAVQEAEDRASVQEIFAKAMSAMRRRRDAALEAESARASASGGAGRKGDKFLALRRAEEQATESLAEGVLGCEPKRGDLDVVMASLSSTFQDERRPSLPVLYREEEEDVEVVAVAAATDPVKSRSPTLPDLGGAPPTLPRVPEVEVEEEESVPAALASGSMAAEVGTGPVASTAPGQAAPRPAALDPSSTPPPPPPSPLPAPAAPASRGSPPHTAPPKPFAIVRFSVVYVTREGQNLVLLGDDDRLGGWRTPECVRMSWTEGHLWTAEVELPCDATYFYKYAIEERGTLTWQQGSNRLLTVPDPSEEGAGPVIEAHDSWDGDPVGSSVMQVGRQTG